MFQTKIVILHMKKLLITSAFLALGIIILALSILLLKGKVSQTASLTWFSRTKSTTSSPKEGTASDASLGSDNQTDEQEALYAPGVYTAQMQLGDSTINLQVTCDSTQVKSVQVVNLDKSVATMYPLVKPAAKKISKQLARQTPIEDVQVSKDSPYTSQLIIDTVSQILDQAASEATADSEGK